MMTIFGTQRRPVIAGYHLIYKYVSDRNRIYNDLKIEVQLRTQLQHAWATAVETVGTFTQQALKSSSGEKSWLRFFALMGSVIAERERSPLIPATPTDRDELLQDLRTLAVKLDVVERLHIYQQSLRVPEVIQEPNVAFYLLELDRSNTSIRIYVFRREEWPAAVTKYMEIERSFADAGTTDAVLVSVDSLRDLRRAFPNYFLDTEKFIEVVTKAIA